MRRRMGILWGCMVLLAGCQTVDENVMPTTQEQRPERVTVELERIVDGDTIKVKYKGKSETVRLLLIDTPETVHPEKKEQPYGMKAKQNANQLLKQGNGKVELEFGEERRDKYDRLLAYVYVNDQSLQERLVSSGLARVAYVYPPNTRYEDQYRELQQKAKQKEKNIWSLEGYVQEDGFHREVFCK